MAKRSSIETMLPNDVREQLESQLIKNGFGKYQELSDWLKNQGYDISKSSVHRHGEKLQKQRRMHEVAKAMTGLSELEQAIILIFDTLSYDKKQKVMEVLYKRC